MSEALTDEVSLLEFLLDGQSFGIACALVSEVLPMLPLRALPGAPPALLGVVSRRGALLPLLDPRPRLGLSAWAPTAAAHIVAVQAGGREVGLVVDAAERVFTVPWKEVCLPGALEPRVPYSLGLVRRAGVDVVVVDLDALVTHDEWKRVGEALELAP